MTIQEERLKEVVSALKKVQGILSRIKVDKDGRVMMPAKDLDKMNGVIKKSKEKKICCTCDQNKSLTDFNSFGSCKDCSNKKARTEYAINGKPGRKNYKKI